MSDQGPPAYDPPPAYAPPPPPPAPASRGGRPPGIVAGAIAALIAAVAVIAYFLFSSGSSGAATPQAAVRKLLDAGTTNDVNKAKSVLCNADRAIGQVAHLQSSGTITSYQVGAQTVQNGVTVVAATFSTTKSSTPSTEKFPVIKEGGSWKVCFSRELALLPQSLPSGAATGFPLPSQGLPTGVTGLPTQLTPPTTPGVTGAVPTIGGVSDLCSGSTSGFGVASTYVGAAEIGVPQVAQACVYRSQVAESVARGLAGKLFGPVTTDPNASVIVFRSSDRSTTVTVTTAKEPDGHYYVIGVTLG
jgi:hypothetical protein